MASLPQSKKYWLNKRVLQVDGNDDNSKGKTDPKPSTSGTSGTSGRQAKRPRPPSSSSSDWEETPFRGQVTRRVLKKKVDKAAPATQEDSSSDSEPTRNVATKVLKKQKQKSAGSDDVQIVFEQAI